MNDRRHPYGAILLLLAVIAHSAPVLADTTQADRNVARAMTLHGRDKLKAGDARTALHLFEAAHALMGSPVTGLDMAKAQVALGLLVQARSTADEVTRIPATPGEAKVVKDARAAAAQLADELTVRIPALAIQVHGLPKGVGVRVRMDGSDIPSSTLVMSQGTNPGDHTVEAAATGYVAVQQTVTLKEGQTLTVNLTLSPVAPVASPPCPAQPAVPPRPTAVSPSQPGARANQDSGHSVPVWAFGVGAAGVAALGVGIRFALDYVMVRRTVAADCPDNVCDGTRYESAKLESLRDRWNLDLGMAIGLGAVGIIGIATGLGGVKANTHKPSDARRPAKSGALMAPWLSPRGAGAGIQGVF